MIPDFKTYIGESVWNDIRRRGNGTDVKKEDDVDLLEPQTFVEYLRKLYKNIDTEFYIFKDLNDIITVPTFESELGSKSTWFIEYDCNKKAVYIWKHFLDKEDKLFDRLNDDYKLTFIRRNSTENFLVEPKTGKSSNKFFIEIIDYILENASDLCKRILVKNDKLSESIWNDIRRRGNGTDVKKEDDIEHLDRDGMYNYILDHYQETKYLTQSKPFKSSDYISIPLFVYGNTIYPCYIKFRQDNGRPKEFTISASIKICEEFIDKLKEFCLIDDNGGFGMVKVFPKEGNITNSFCLKVFETILENVKKPAYQKKINVSESVWNDIRRRGIGTDVKKEDDINNLDGSGLKDYITSHYKPLNEYAIVTYVMDILSVPIVKANVNYPIQYCQGSTLVSKITVSSDLLNIVDGLLENLKNNFSIEEHKTSTIIYGVTPKDGSEVTNKFFIEVIDFILDNIHDSNYYKKAIKKINNKS